MTNLKINNEVLLNIIEPIGTNVQPITLLPSKDKASLSKHCRSSYIATMPIIHQHSHLAMSCLVSFLNIPTSVDEACKSDCFSLNSEGIAWCSIMSVSSVRSLDVITQELDLADMTKTGMTRNVSGKNKIMPISISPEVQSQICLSCMRHTGLASPAIF